MHMFVDYAEVEGRWGGDELAGTLPLVVGWVGVE